MSAASTPGVAEADRRAYPALQAATLCEAFQRTAALHADFTALRTPDDSVVITWADYAARVQRTAAGLAALGVGGGDSVGIMLVNRPEFNVVDVAALHLGATPFSVYNSSTVKQISYLFANAGNRLPLRPGGRAISFLPCAHIADRWNIHYHVSLGLGFQVTCLADPRGVAALLPQVRPTLWGAVPRIWEKIKASLEANGTTDPATLGAEERAAIRKRLGLDQCEALIAGGAPTPPGLLRYFADLGLEICELFGMSETSCVISCNPPGQVKLGTCGPPIAGAEIRLAADRELLTRGPMVMAGYRGDPERTAEAIDADGWLHTGDIARVDEDGYITIVDRKKELIINAAGKNMSPANIEAALKSAHPLIGQAVVIGDRRPYNVALVVLDPDVAAAFASEHGIGSTPAAIASDQRVRAAVAEAIVDANTRLARVEQIKRHAILPLDWEPGGDELTPTMKLKRRPIAEKYATEIDALYA